MNGQELATAIGLRRAGKLAQHRRRQRHLRHDPHAPGARVPGPRLGQRPRQPRLRRARARLRLAGRRARRHDRRVRAGARGGARGGPAGADPPAARCRRDHEPDDAAGDPRHGRAARAPARPGACHDADDRRGADRLPRRRRRRRRPGRRPGARRGGPRGRSSLDAADGIGTGTASRNSEVIHAGIYYAPGSAEGAALRARPASCSIRIAKRTASTTGAAAS